MAAEPANTSRIKTIMYLNNVKKRKLQVNVKYTEGDFRLMNRKNTKIAFYG